MGEGSSIVREAFFSLPEDAMTISLGKVHQERGSERSSQVQKHKQADLEVLAKWPRLLDEADLILAMWQKLLDWTEHLKWDDIS